MADRPAPIEIQTSRAARRFIARRYGGCVYVWPPTGDAPVWIDGSQAMEAAPAAPTGRASDFWRHDVGEIAVFTREDVVPPDGSPILFLDYRRNPRGRIVAGWTSNFSELAGGLIQLLYVILFPFR